MDLLIKLLEDASGSALQQHLINYISVYAYTEYYGALKDSKIINEIEKK
jgi:hypothetical protein